MILKTPLKLGSGVGEEEIDFAGTTTDKWVGKVKYFYYQIVSIIMLQYYF